MLNGKDCNNNMYLIGKTTCSMGRPELSYLSNREDHMLNGKDRSNDICLIGKTTCLMGRTIASIFLS
jgi:hypothetical protein